jgi:ABC-type cobalamin/Fe3+-siderophores transport system ATPase subunit
MSMSPETQNMKLKRNMVYLTQEEMYVNPLGIRRLILVGLSKSTGSSSNFF